MCAMWMDSAWLNPAGAWVNKATVVGWAMCPTRASVSALLSPAAYLYHNEGSDKGSDNWSELHSLIFFLPVKPCAYLMLLPVVTVQT